MSGKLRKNLCSEEQRKAFRDAMAAELEKRLEMMRKRQAYFSAVAGSKLCQQHYEYSNRRECR